MRMNNALMHVLARVAAGIPTTKPKNTKRKPKNVRARRKMAKASRKKNRN